MGQGAPDHAVAQDVEHGIDEFPTRMRWRPTTRLRGRDQGFEVEPLGIGEVGGITMAGHGAGSFPSATLLLSYQTSPSQTGS